MIAMYKLILTSRSDPLDPVQESINVVKQLGDDEMSSGMNLLGQEVDIGLGTIRVHMRGRVPCNEWTAVSCILSSIELTQAHPPLRHRTSLSIPDLCIERDPRRIRNPVLLPQLPGLPYPGRREVKYQVQEQDGTPPSVVGLGVEIGASSAFGNNMN